MIEILKQDQAILIAENRRREMSKGILPIIETTVATKIKEAVEHGETKVQFVCHKAYATVLQIKSYITPLLEKAGYNDFKITAAKSRTQVWFSINIKNKK